MSEFIAAQAAVKLVPSFDGFKKKVDAELKAMPAELKIELKAQTKAFLAEVEAAKKAASGDIKVGIDEKSRSKANRDLDELTHKLDRFNNRSSLFRLSIVVEGLALLPQLGTAAAAAAKSVEDLSGVVALLPAGFSAAGASLATLLTGVTGVKAAFQAYSQATKESIQDQQTAAQTARDLKNAHLDLSNAVKDARRNLEDLHAEMRDAPLNEADAILSLREAQQEAANAAGKTALQRQRDVLNIEKAESRLADVRTKNGRLAQDTAAADAKGVANADGVVKAQERVTAAQDKTSTGTKKIETALRQLSPQTQDFVTKVHSLGDAWTKVHFAIGDKLFAGLGDQVVGLSKNLPLVEKGFGGIASALNNNVKTALSAVGSDQNKSFLERIFGNDARTQQLLSRSITPLINAFLRLSAVGSDFLPRLANGFGNLAEKFDAFVTKADQDGSLKNWIDRSLKAWSQVGHILGDALSIIHSITEAFGKSGGQGMLGSLEKVSDKLAAFLKSDKGQDKLIQFFHNSRAELEGWKQPLKNAWDGVKQIFSAIKEWAEFTRPFFSFVSAALGKHPALAQAVVTAYLGFKTIAPILEGIIGAFKLWTTGIGGVKGASEKLQKFVGVGGPLMLAVTALGGYIAGNFITAMDEGSQALERQRSKAEELTNQLDDVTGAATQASQALVISNLQHAKNSATGEDYGNLLDEAQKRGIDTKGLTAAIASGDKSQVDAVLAPINGATKDAVEKSDFYQQNKDSLAQSGITPDGLAKAVNGDPEWVKRFTDWRDGVGRKLLGFNASHDTLRGMELSHLINLPSNLQDLKKSLPGDVQTGANLAGNINEQLSGTVGSQRDITQKNTTQFGSFALNAQGKAIFGANATVRGNANGVSVLVPGRINDTLKANVENNGGTVTDLLNSTRIDLNKSRAKLYVDGLPPGFASGGLFRGRGTSTSDSNVIRASDGEFINRAASVRKYGTGLFDALNAGAIHPDALPKFDSGGQVILPFPNPGITPGSNPLLAGPAAGFNGQVIPTSPATIPSSVLGDNPHVNDLFGIPTGLPGSAYQPVDKGLPGPLGQLPQPTPPTPPVTTFRPGAVGEADRQILEGAGIPVGSSPHEAGSPGDSHTGGAGSFQPGPGGVSTVPGTPGPLSIPGAGTNAAHIPGAAPGPAGGTPDIPFSVTSSIPPEVAPPPNNGTQGPLGNNLPPNLQPQSLLSQIGKILLEGFLGIFGIDPGPIEQLLGMIPGLGIGADPQAQQDINSYQTPVDPKTLANVATNAGVTLGPNGEVYLPNLTGSGALPDTKSTALSAVKNAPINPDANILDYLTQVAHAYGLQAGSGPIDPAIAKSLGISTHNDDGAQHSVDRALDIGSADQAKKGEISSFVKQWMSDPQKVSSTRQLIFRGPDGDYGIINGRVLTGQELQSVYGGDLGGHTDHVHLALEGVPLSAFAQQVTQQAAQPTPPAPAQSSAVTADSSPQDVARYIYNSALGAGYSPSDAKAIVAYSVGESGLNPRISGGQQGDDEVIGLFQEKAAFSGGLNRDQRMDPANNVTSYLNQLAKHRGQGDIYDQLLATSVGGPMYTGGRPYMAQLEQRASQYLGFAGGGSARGMIRISHGEYRTNPASVKKYGVGLFNALNAGAIDPNHLPGFDGGGEVGRGANNQNWNGTWGGQYVPWPRGTKPISGIFSSGIQLDASRVWLDPGVNSPRVTPSALTDMAWPDGNRTPPGSYNPGGGIFSLPKFADGGWFKDVQKSPNSYGQSNGPLATPSNVGARAGQGLSQGLGKPSGIGGAAGHSLKVNPGAEGPAGSQRKKDPRSVLGAPPANSDHNLPALSKGIQGVGNAIGTAASTAASVAAAAGSFGAGGGAGSAAAGALIGNAVQVGTQAAQGVANIFSSLLVGTITPGTTEGAYGTPLLPTPNETQINGPRVQNNIGNVYTSNPAEFWQGQSRREAQQMAPLLGPNG